MIPASRTETVKITFVLGLILSGAIAVRHALETKIVPSMPFVTNSRIAAPVLACPMPMSAQTTTPLRMFNRGNTVSVRITALGVVNASLWMPQLNACRVVHHRMVNAPAVESVIPLEMTKYLVCVFRQEMYPRAAYAVHSKIDVDRIWNAHTSEIDPDASHFASPGGTVIEGLAAVP